MKSININITTRTTVTFLSIIGLIWLMIHTKDVLLFLFASFIIASSLFPVITFLDKKLQRWLSVTIVYAGGFLALSTLFIPLFIILSKQANELILTLPKYYTSFENFLMQIKTDTIFLHLLPAHNEIISSIAGLGENLVSKSIDLTINMFGAVIGGFTLATIVLFMLLDKEELKQGLLSFFNPDVRNKAEHIFFTIAQRVGGYVRGQLFVMIAIGITTGVALQILGVKFAFLLGMIAGILEIVPIIGPILAAIPAILIALASSPLLALLVALIYLIIQRVENLISPYIYGKFLNLPPLVIIIAILISASTLGVVGVVLSPAMAAAIYVLVQELYLNKINNTEEEINI